MAHANNKPLAIRLCDSMAAICLAEELAHQALHLPTGNMPGLCAELLQQISETDRAAEALRYVHAWAIANQGHFYRAGSGTQNHPLTSEYFGRWDGAHAEWIGILPLYLERALAEGKYDIASIVPAWQGRGWLQLEQEGETMRTRIRTRVGGKPNARVIAILRSALEEVDPPGPDAADSAAETGLDEEDDEPDGPDADEDPDGDDAEDEGEPDED